MQVDNSAIHVAADRGHFDVLQLLLPVAFAKNPGIIGKKNKVQVIKFFFPFWLVPSIPSISIRNLRYM